MAEKQPHQSGFTVNHLSAVVIGGAALMFFLYLSSDGRLANTGGDDDEAVARRLKEAAPESQAAAWSEWRPSPVGAIDDEATEESFFVEAPEVVELAWGWSQARAEPIPTVCIEYGVDSRSAQTSDIKITEVRDSYSLAKAMNVSASVSVKSVNYRASGKASFASNSNVSSSSVTYLVNAEVLNGAEYVGPPEAGPVGNTSTGAVRLTDAAAAMALRDIERFQAVCGEGFISATISGARAYLLAETVTSSRDERQSVRASVKGSGWGVKVAAAAGLSTNSATENLTRNITFYQQGGAAIPDGADAYGAAGAFAVAQREAAEAEAAEQTDVGDVGETALPGTAATGPEGAKSDEPYAPDPIAAGIAGQASLPKTAEEAIDRITLLPVAAATAGKVFELQITPYQVLENFPRGEDLLAAEDEQDEIAADWGAYQTLYADLKAVLENPGVYSVPIATCTGAGEAAQCDVAMTPLVGDDDAVNAEAIAIVEALQDMTLRAMNEIEIAAETCMVLEEHCDYDGSLVRSPYSVRAGMPVLTTVERQPEDDDGDPVTEDVEVSDEDHLIQHLREPALGRCVFGAGTSGCISNAETRRWAARTGLATVVVTEDREDLVNMITNCPGVEPAHLLEGDGDDDKAPTLWFPAAAIGPDGSPGCELEEERPGDDERAAEAAQESAEAEALAEGQ